MNEVDIWRKLDHPNIVKIIDFYSLNTEYNIINEWCQEDELFDEIKIYSPFNESLDSWYLKQILSGVSYCQNMNIINRDFKPLKKVEHVLIDSAYYIIPEVLSKNYTELCDLWNCGVIIYIFLTDSPSFNGSSEEEIMKKNKRRNI